MAIKQQEWADWLRHPVTETVLNYLDSRKDALTEQLINLDIQDSVEEYGVKALFLRAHLEGLGEMLDIESLSESIVEVSHED